MRRWLRSECFLDQLSKKTDTIHKTVKENELRIDTKKEIGTNSAPIGKKSIKKFPSELISRGNCVKILVSIE